jgi:hypothetical protein
MRKLVISSIICTLFLSAFGQGISNPQLEYKRFANLNRVTHFVIENKCFLWGITAAGDVVKWNLQNEKPLSHPLERLQRRATAIMFDRRGNLVLGFEDGSISRFNADARKLEPLPAKAKGEIQFLLTDSGNNYWAITPQGIFNAAGKVIHSPNESAFAYNNEWPDLSCEPISACMDSQDKIWVGFNKGEFGGDLYCFDTQKKVFIDFTFCNIDEYEKYKMGPPFQSIFANDQGDIYMTTGSDHLMPGHGRLYQFSGTEGKLVFNWSEQPMVRVKGWDMEEYVGPGFYNSQTKKIYYYSDRGFFRQKGTGKNIEGWELVIKPEMFWTGGGFQVGPAMNIIQFDFIDGEDFVFTAMLDGVGIYREGKIHFLNRECSRSDKVEKLLPGEKLMLVFGSDNGEDQYNLYENGKVRDFSLKGKMGEQYEDINGAVVLPGDQIVMILQKKAKQEPSRQTGEEENHEYHSYAFADNQYIRLKELPFPVFPIWCSQCIICDQLSSGRFLIRDKNKVVEFNEGKYKTVYTGEVDWARYNNDGSILIALPNTQCEGIAENEIICINDNKKFELDLTAISHTRKELDVILDSRYAWRGEKEWEYLGNIKKLKMIWYQGKPLYVSGEEALSYSNRMWENRKDIEEWLGHEDVTFFDYFPALNMFLFQNKISLFARAQGKTIDLGKCLDLACEVITARLWNGRLFLGTNGRGLVEFGSQELLKLIAQTPDKKDEN